MVYIEHIKKWTDSFRVRIYCLIKNSLPFERGSMQGDKFNCKRCGEQLNFTEIINAHTGTTEVNRDE